MIWFEVAYLRHPLPWRGFEALGHARRRLDLDRDDRPGRSAQMAAGRFEAYPVPKTENGAVSVSPYPCLPPVMTPISFTIR